MTSTVTKTVTDAISSTVTQTATQTVYDRDPYLDYQPAFAYSLPIQFLLTGVILSMSTILLINLVFTSPYHWPLAKLNFMLQMAGVSSLLLTLAVTLSVILSSVHGTSREWPYMLNYIAVDVPVTNWSSVDNGLWYTLDAITSGLAHTTHIQFLTLLYPSPMERKLVFLLLGPLVLASSITSFISLSPSAATKAVAESVRNICNTTLAIIFSVALVLWGVAINRKEAWRTDGGTAIFGGGAVAFSLLTVGLNLFQIVKVPPVWIPPLLWAVVLWQSFLGWWWYVGSAAPEPPSAANEARKKRKRKRIENNISDSKFSRFKQRVGLGTTIADDGTDSRSHTLRRRRGLERSRSDGGMGDGSRVSLSRSDSTVSLRAHEDEQDAVTLSAPSTTHAEMASTLRPVRSPNGNGSPSSTWFGGLANYLPAALSNWWHRVRQEHNSAAEIQNAQTVQRHYRIFGMRGGLFIKTPMQVDAITASRGAATRATTASHSMYYDSDPARDATHTRNGRSHTGRDVELRDMAWPSSPWETTDSNLPRADFGDEPRPREPANRTRPPLDRQQLSAPNSSWSWMGPFQRWRLRDVSTF